MNFRKVSKKIKTIGNVSKITRAMQMVSAVKMRRAQQAAISARPYCQKLQEVLARLVDNGSIAKSEISYLKPGQGDKTLIILVSSNKGLCGGFNFNLFKFVLKDPELARADFINIGSKGASFSRRISNSIADFSGNMPQDSAAAIFQAVSETYFATPYKKVVLVYNRYNSALSYTPVTQDFLPVEKIADLAGTEVASRSPYTIEPVSKALLVQVIEDLLVEKIRAAILDSSAAEHSARMMAMKAATDNAGELISGLTLYRNKLRQASITSELLEMTAATQTSI